ESVTPPDPGQIRSAGRRRPVPGADRPGDADLRRAAAGRAGRHRPGDGRPGQRRARTADPRRGRVAGPPGRQPVGRPEAPGPGRWPRRGGTRTRPAASLSPHGFRTVLARQARLTARRGCRSFAALFAIPLVCTVIAIVSSGTGLRPGAGMTSVLAILITVAAL